MPVDLFRPLVHVLQFGTSLHGPAGGCGVVIADVVVAVVVAKVVDVEPFGFVANAGITNSTTTQLPHTHTLS